MKIPMWTLVGLILACTTSALAADAQPGFLVFEKPSFDNNLAPVLGQARPITNVHMKEGSTHTVEIAYQKDEKQHDLYLPVTFVRESSAAAFLADALAGGSFDVTDCAHAGSEDPRRVRVSEYCDKTATKAKFECTWRDDVNLINSSIDFSQYSVPEQVEVYLIGESCRPAK